MQIVIDIPAKVVKAIQNGKDYRYDIHTAIAQGTPLPKDLIPIADVMSVFDDFMKGDVDENETETFLEMLKEKMVVSDADKEGEE